MNIFRPERIEIGGLEHHGGRLHDGRLVKWLREDQLAGGKRLGDLAKDLEALKKLDVKMPQTELLGPSVVELGGVSHSVPYVLISEWIEGHPLRLTDLSQDAVRTDFAHALSASKILESSLHRSIDFFRHVDVIKGLTKRGALSPNFVVNESGAYLVDPSLRVLDKPSSVRKAISTRVWTEVQHILVNALVPSR